MASIHSSVSTSLAVRSQSTVGNAEIRIVLGVLGHLRERRRFQAEIHLDRDRAAQRVDDLDEPQPPRLGGKVFGVARDKGEGAQIGVEAPLDAGPQHLHRDRRAIRSPSRPRRDAPGRSRRPRPAAPKFANIAPTGLPNEAATAASASSCGNGGIWSCSRSRSRASVAPTTSGPRRQELAELDVARPEPRERRRQPRFHSPAGRALEQPRDAQQRPRRRRHQRRIDGAEHALAGEHEAGSAETDEMRGTGDHKRQPECNATMPPVISLVRDAGKAGLPQHALRTPAAWESGGSIPPDSDRRRRRRRLRGRARE